jgi:prepilin-type N-terminal cleavage/methylation domain-containing protein
MSLRKKSKAGVTLIELLMAIVILVIAVIPITSVYVTSLREAAHARRLTIATFVAQQKIEEMVGLSWEQIVNYKWESNGAAGLTWQVKNPVPNVMPADDALLLDNGATPIIEDNFDVNIKIYLKELTADAAAPQPLLIRMSVTVNELNGNGLCVQENILNVVGGGIAG